MAGQSVDKLIAKYGSLENASYCAGALALKVSQLTSDKPDPLPIAPGERPDLEEILLNLLPKFKYNTGDERLIHAVIWKRDEPADEYICDCTGFAVIATAILSGSDIGVNITGESIYLYGQQHRVLYLGVKSSHKIQSSNRGQFIVMLSQDSWIGLYLEGIVSGTIEYHLKKSRDALLTELDDYVNDGTFTFKNVQHSLAKCIIQLEPWSAFRYSRSATSGEFELVVAEDIPSIPPVS